MSNIPQKMLETRFEAWFNEEMPRLYRYLCYQTRDRDAAEEITSRVCERALSRIGQYDPSRGELRMWIFGIARNELRGYFRTMQKSPSEISFEQLPDFSFPGRSPEEELQRKEIFFAVLKEINNLPGREQEVIALRFGAGLSVGEVGAILGITENNAGVLLHRTIEKLKNILEESPHGIQ